MRFLLYLVCTTAGFLAAVAVVAVICASSAPAPVSKAEPPGQVAASSQLRSPVLPRLPREVVHPPARFKSLDSAGLASLLGGPEVVAVLDRADRVTSVLLKLPQLELVAPSRIPATTPEVAVDLATAARVRAALFDPARNLQGNYVPGCAPQYGWKLSFFADGRHVDFYFCFGCGHLAVDLDGTTVGHVQFGVVIEELRTVMDSIPHAGAEGKVPDADGRRLE